MRGRLCHSIEDGTVCLILSGAYDLWLTLSLVDETSIEYNVGDYVAVCYELDEDSEQGPAKRRKRTPPEQQLDESNIEIVDEDNDLVNIDECGLAKVIECRAADSEHVYLRIIWLYRPEETEDGRQPWQAEDELIPSTHMQIVDAVTCNGSIQVHKWEPGVEGGPVQRRRFWWRQTLDTIGKGKLSSIEDDCICERPTDLSQGIWAKDMIQCTDDECEGWMHTACVCNAAKAQVLADIENDDSPFEKIEDPSVIDNTLDIPDPFEETTSNGIRGHINSFTAGLVSMMTPSSSRTTPAAPPSQNRRSDRKGKSKRKDDNSDDSIAAEVDPETCQIQLVEVETKKKISVPVTCLFCHETLKPAEAVEAPGA